MIKKPEIKVNKLNFNHTDEEVKAAIDYAKRQISSLFNRLEDIKQGGIKNPRSYCSKYNKLVDIDEFLISLSLGGKVTEETLTNLVKDLSDIDSYLYDNGFAHTCCDEVLEALDGVIFNCDADPKGTE